MLKEFKEFATRGNIMDLAIGVVIGGAFQKIVNSLVEDVIMPFISIITGKVDFSDMVLTIGNASIKYGNFITTIVNFLIISFSIFLVVRYLNKLNKLKDKDFDKLVHKLDKLDKNGQFKKFKKSKQEAKEVTEKEPETKICPYCLSEIKYKATRCPNCTSKLDDLDNILEETEVNTSQDIEKEDIDIQEVTEETVEKND